MQKRKLGVVVGRFQVPEIHQGHRHLIDYVSNKNDELLIVIGSGRGFPTPRNPLSFETRKEMLLHEYPNATVAQIFDNPSDNEWSLDLDSIVAALFSRYEVTLYGSRDSFIPHYHGQYATEKVLEVSSPDGTSIRAHCENTHKSVDFRKGLIHAQMERAPIPYPVVDVAIIRKETGEVLLGQKRQDMEKWRFVGGFFDPVLDTTLEGAVHREAFEETSGLEIGAPIYIGSRIINDWRYRKDSDRIISSFFMAPYIFGAPRPSDDLDSLAWFPYEKLLEVLVPQHQSLGELLIRTLNHSTKGECHEHANHS
jgi:bifunctional NMN adenylyltransferase/nudix hydrolase